MFVFLLATALLGQIDRIELNNLQFQVESQQVLKISQSELPKTKKLKKRVVFDIKPAKLSPKAPRTMVAKNQAIVKIRIAQHSKDTVRVVAEVKGSPKLSMKRVGPKNPGGISKKLAQVAEIPPDPPLLKGGEG